MSLPSYPTYKDSGVEWLGPVPTHWEVKPNKAFLSQCKSEVGTSSSEKTLLSLTLKGVIPRDIESGKGKFPADFGTYQDVEKGDLVFCLFDVDETPRTIGLAQEDGMITGAYDVFRCKDGALPQFVVNYYLHIDSFKGLRPFYTGLRKVVRPPTFMAVKIPLPPLAEQTQIAAFLDRETAKIDELVAEQRRLMELLKEKRQAVISHAVTQGLNPDAPMKPSGIEWLGDVPKHWNYGPLKYLATIKTGYAFSSDDFVGEGIPVLRIGDITTEGNVDFTNARCLPAEYEAEHSDVLVVRSDIVMAMTGATIGKAGWYASDRPALLNQRVCIFRVVAPNAQRYLWHILSARFYTEHIALAAVGGAQPNISDSQLLQCVVPLPPESEQTDIAAFLDTETAKFDTLTAEAQHAIDLLQERRTALISAAVTGQIDVRQLSQTQKVGAGGTAIRSGESSAA